MIELACHDPSCAPPPAGTGGSAPGAGPGGRRDVANDSMVPATTAIKRKSLPNVSTDRLQRRHAVLSGIVLAGRIPGGRRGFIERAYELTGIENELKDRGVEVDRVTEDQRGRERAKPASSTLAGSKRVTMYRTVNVPAGTSVHDVVKDAGRFWSKNQSESRRYAKGEAMQVAVEFTKDTLDKGTQTSPAAWTLPAGAKGKVVKAWRSTGDGKWEVIPVDEPIAVDTGDADPSKVYASAMLPLEFYSDSQPRDSRGRWSDGGALVPVKVIDTLNPKFVSNEGIRAMGEAFAKEHGAHYRDESPDFARASDVKWDWSGGGRYAPSWTSREVFVDTMLHARTEDDREPEHVQTTVRETQAQLEAAFGKGATVLLYRGVSNSDNPFNENPLEKYGNYTGNMKNPSGITSWSSSAFSVGSYGSGTVVVAAVPIDRILSWDRAGNMTGSGKGDEVLVGSREGVAKAMKGEFPAMQRVGLSAAAGEVEEFYDPGQPRDRRGRWSDGGASGLVDQGLASPRVREVISDMSDPEVSADYRAASEKKARKWMDERAKAIATSYLEHGVPSPNVVAEYEMLSAAFPPAEGYVRPGSHEAEALRQDIKAILPNAEVAIFGDVHDESVLRIMSGIDNFPPEVRGAVRAVAVGFVEDEGLLAAFGPSQNRRFPPSTLWLGPKVVRPSSGHPAKADAATIVSRVDPEFRHSVVGVHEMGHVVHSMAIAKDRASGKLDQSVFTQNDPVVPSWVKTTPYGEKNPGERVAETFAAAGAFGFRSLDEGQQRLITDTLGRAGLSKEDMPVLQFGVLDDMDDDERWFIGDDFDVEEL